MATLRIGMIGLDTSHAPAFAAMLNDPSDPHHVPGGTVAFGYPGGVSDFALSASRVEAYTRTLREQYGVRMLESLSELARLSDAILLTSVDGRVHLRQFAEIAPYRKPVFIDKPFALSSVDAGEMAALAKTYGTPLFTCSSVRYGEGLVAALKQPGREEIYGADCSGPMPLEPTQNGLFWYGIHAVETLYAVMGAGCVQVTAARTEEHELATGIWADGRIGVVRGNRKGNRAIHAVLHRPAGTECVDVLGQDSLSAYQGTLTDFIAMARGAEPPIPLGLSLELVRFIEAANESRETGLAVRLREAENDA